MINVLEIIKAGDASFHDGLHMKSRSAEAKNVATKITNLILQSEGLETDSEDEVIPENNNKLFINEIFNIIEEVL